MTPPIRNSLLFFLTWILLTWNTHAASPFMAGASAVEISPAQWPVRVNGGFTERSADRVVDPLQAKALVMEHRGVRVAFCVVDTCMIPRTLIDKAKTLASKATGIPANRMLVSATHTHSAPSSMGCLGTRPDPRYLATLPSRMAHAIIAAETRLEPASVGWSKVNDWKHTHNRRWIRRPDKIFADPFGDKTVRAHMHPGHQNPDVIGPSGPVDPGITVLALKSKQGKPLALFANYSMHYYGSPALSSDYYGRFAGHLAKMLNADDDFVAIMTQGTSGDLMWMDYGAPRRDLGYDAYAREIATEVSGLFHGVDWQDEAPIRIVERLLPLAYRVPDPERLAWARERVRELEGKLPQTKPDIYAMESVYLHERQQTELVLQAIGIGELGITAIPNEVYALTGLKLKRQSPFPVHMNISLANGAEGYIPPMEQHVLGGYTTWPARTAGLETGAEARIVEDLLSMLEEVSGDPRRPLKPFNGPYPKRILSDDPVAYWRLEDMQMPAARDMTGMHDAHMEKGVALFLPGVNGESSHFSPETPLPNAFSGMQINRAIHFAGGRMWSDVPLKTHYTVECWVWNGLPADAREVSGYFYGRGKDGDEVSAWEKLGVGGTQHPSLAGRLFLHNGVEPSRILGGHTTLAKQGWHHVVFVREGSKVKVYLDGRPEPEIQGDMQAGFPGKGSRLFLGGGPDSAYTWEGKLDELAIYDHVLRPEDVTAHYNISGLTPPTKISTMGPLQPPLSPEASTGKIHIREGYKVVLAAAEPLTSDPVAIDWDASGKLWIAEMADYPIGMDQHGGTGGRVRVLEDKDSNGVYDQSTLFADGLSFPTGLLTWRGGVIVSAAPDILFLKDTDGDQRADLRRVLISGLSEGNQQLRANGLRWGLDGWVYCAAGGHHVNYGKQTKLRTSRGDFNVGARDFRFRPDTGELEPVSGPSQNGRNRNDWGAWFGTQNSRPLWHYVLPDRYLRRNPHLKPPSPTQLVVTPLNPKVYPASSKEKRFHSFDQAGRFTSACGGMLYRDIHLFGISGEEQHAFSCEPFHNLVQHNIVTSDGVTFKARRDAPGETLDFFASEDRWCRPVMARTGPDGALWIVDMYRYMIEHPDWLPPEGRAELLPNYRLGEKYGRIYRVIPARPEKATVPNLAEHSTQALVQTLASSNGWLRDKAQMLLTWRADRSALPHLHAILEEMSHPLESLHALWLLDSFDDLSEEELVRALAHPHPGLRRNALMLAESRDTALIATALQGMVQDTDPKVMLQLAFSLGSLTSSTAGKTLASLIPASTGKPFLQAAVLSAAPGHLSALTQALEPAPASLRETLTAPLLELSLALGNRETLAALLEPNLIPTTQGFLPQQMESFSHFIDLLAVGKTSIQTLAMGSDSLARLLTEARGNTASSIFSEAFHIMKDKTASKKIRMAASRLSTRDSQRRVEVLSILSDWLAPQQSPILQRASLDGMIATGSTKVPGVVFKRWPALPPSLRTQAIETLLSREAWTHAMLNRFQNDTVIPLTPVQRDRLLRHRSKKIRSLASEVLTRPSSRRDVIRTYEASLKLQGDPVKGGKIFSEACATCHQTSERGSRLGPNLNSVAGHSKKKLLSNILAPSADVQPGYQAYQCSLADGTEIYGLIQTETGTSITMTSPDGGEHTILRRDIQELRGGNLSLMPEGFEELLSIQDMADLIQWLREGQ
jgi:putative membrane-bound dehydrogenase-like protein